jgi:toxin ParE1/3/4
VIHVRWLDTAVADVGELHAYIASDNPQAAARIVQRIVAAVETLSAAPKKGRGGRVRGTRELVIAGTPFLAAYRETADTVEVLRILHGARRWPDAL